MNNVNTRIHDFYWKGHQEGQEEIMDYIERLAAHYAQTQVKEESLGKIIGIMGTVIQTQLNIQRKSAIGATDDSV